MNIDNLSPISDENIAKLMRDFKVAPKQYYESTMLGTTSIAAGFIFLNSNNKEMRDVPIKLFKIATEVYLEKDKPISIRVLNEKQCLDYLIR